MVLAVPSLARVLATFLATATSLALVWVISLVRVSFVGVRS